IGAVHRGRGWRAAPLETVKPARPVFGGRQANDLAIGIFQFTGGEEDGRANLLDDALVAFGWAFWIDEDIGGAKTQRRNEQRVGLAPFRQLESDDIAAPDAAVKQRRTASLCQSTQFSVGYRA